MKTYLKTLLRAFKKHATRFISIIFIVLVSVGFISGIGTSTDKIRYSLSDYYKSQNVSDFIIKTTAEDGFSEEEIKAVRSLYGEENVNTGAAFDVYVGVNGEKQLVRLYFLDDFGKETVNVCETVEKVSFTEDETDLNIAHVEMPDNKIKGIPAKTNIKLDFKDVLEQLAKQGGKELDPDISSMLDYLKPETTLTVGNTVKSPLTFAQDGEPSWTNPEDTEIPDTINAVNELITVDNILFASTDAIPEIPAIPFVHPEAEKLIKTTDMFVSFADKSQFNAFDRKYENYVEEQKAAVLSALESVQTTAVEEQEKQGENEAVKFITLYKNYSFVSLKGYADKVMDIGLVLMVAFLFVTALVVLSNMTRLMEEERPQIACLKTLGYNNFKIIFKYFLFAMLATGIGGGGSYFVGLGLAYLICYVFNYSFSMPPISSQIALPFFLIVLSVIIITTLGATFIAGVKMTGETPAELLRPKPPRAGKKVFLERIPIIWNRFSFKYKSTMRNVLRYLPRFIMTVVSVAVSTALVLAGFALLDICIFGGLNAPSVMGIAFVVIVFAGLLTAVVIYTLTNINISERNRELATLKVLGYHDKEVSGYIYREVYIDTAVGILFGYPLSTLIMMLLFYIMGMGTIGGVTWFWWLTAPFIVFLFTYIVTLMLKPKIRKIDMNESLKAIE